MTKQEIVDLLQRAGLKLAPRHRVYGDGQIVELILCDIPFFARYNPGHEMPSRFEPIGPICSFSEIKQYTVLDAISLSIAQPFCER